MKRAPLWVFVAAVGIQIAALWLCVWAMERLSDVNTDDGDRRPEGAPPPAPPAPERPAPPPSAQPPSRAYESRSEPRILTRPPGQAHLDERVPAFIAEAADGTTQIVRSDAGGRPLAFGFYPDGHIRFVDVDGGRYAGKAESARARMREVDGSRAFTVQIGVAPDGRLQATFTGGLHDLETLPLEPLVGWNVA